MIESLDYSIGIAGIRAGVPMYTIYLGEGSFDYADVILALREYTAKGAKVVQIAGADPFTHENADDIFALVTALDDAGYITYVQTDGSTYYPWMTKVKLNSVYITSKWLPRKVQEFVWAAPGAFILPPDHLGSTLFLDLDTERTRRILHSSSLNWRIYRPDVTLINEYLLGGEPGVA